MTLKEDFTSLKDDVTSIKSDISEIKDDLAHHIRRTEILENRQESFEVLIKEFKASSKEVETAALIIKRVWKPIIFLFCLLSSIAAINQITEIFTKIL